MQTDSAPDPVVLTRQRLSSRPSRPSDPVRENAALLALVNEMAQRPDNVLNLLCELILQICSADSAGVSLLREETDEFVWPAVAGAWAPFVNGSMPRSASPCGKVIDTDEVLIFRDVPAQFPATRQATPDIEEILLAPFHRDGEPIGTVWAVSHDPLRKFDAEDRRVLTGLARFAAAAYHTTSAHQSSQQSGATLKSAVELAGLGLYSIEIKGEDNLLTWDNRVRSLWGLPPDCAVTYDMWEEGIHADDRERVRVAVSRAYDPSADGVYDVEYRVIGADGVERWVATRAKARFEHGQPVSLLGVVRDITDRKMIERGLELVVDVRTSELIDASATLQAEREARQRTADRLELLQGELSRGLFAAIESRQAGLARPAERRVRDAANKMTQLTPREQQVLEGLVRGEQHKTIAHRLGISARTVELHRSRMLHRLGTPHLADAIRLAVFAELAGD